MWQQAGASIVSVPCNEVYNALQTGVADATDTSAGSFVSFRIYEQVKCITAPGDNALWFMYEPVLMSKKAFDKLNKQQQDVLIKAGKKSEEYFNKATKGLDDEMVETFKKNNVEVVTLTPAEYEAWLKVAQESSYKPVRRRSAGRQEADRRGAGGEITLSRYRYPAAAYAAGRSVDARWEQWTDEHSQSASGWSRKPAGSLPRRHCGGAWSSSARWCSSATCSTRTRSGRPISSPTA